MIVIFAHIPNNERSLTLHVSTSDTIGSVCALVEGHSGIPKRHQRVTFGGVQLEMDSTIFMSNILNNSSVDITQRISGGARTKGITKTEKVSLCEHKFQAMLKVLKKPNPNAMEKLVMLLKDSQELPPAAEEALGHHHLPRAGADLPEHQQQRCRGRLGAPQAEVAFFGVEGRQGVSGVFPRGLGGQEGQRGRGAGLRPPGERRERRVFDV